MKSNLESRVVKVFSLNDRNWMRHSNPWSVATRYPVLPLLLLSVWSRSWIGWWCLVPVGLTIGWTFLNPIAFSPPKSTKNWASRSVLGERVYLNRREVPLGENHQSRIFVILNVLSMLGLFLAIWGVVVYSVWATVMGIILTIIGKSWFLDRMVWVYEDMKNSSEEYKSWDY